MFGHSEKEWAKREAINTATEIFAQPATWKKTVEIIQNMKEELMNFINPVISQSDFDIIMTGAGTSEYVGNAAFPAFLGEYDLKVRSVPTTDIVAAPQKFLSKDKATLLISFARSGDSPESVGAVVAADAICNDIRHLFITCNKDGALAKVAYQKKNSFCIVLSPETNDKGFAMTNSFSNMYLAVICVLRLEKLKEIAQKVELISTAAEKLINNYEEVNGIIDSFDYDRIIYLGTAELKGIAQESRLKTLELTAGKIGAIFDTPMGFRHGPKSFVNDKTLTVIYLSDDENTRRYEMDLLKEMYSQYKENQIMVVENEMDIEVQRLCKTCISFNFGEKLESAYLGLGYIVVAQILALMKSQKLGLTTDNPCPTGEVNRVVKGVTIYSTDK